MVISILFLISLVGGVIGMGIAVIGLGAMTLSEDLVSDWGEHLCKAGVIIAISSLVIFIVAVIIMFIIAIIMMLV